MSYKSKFKYNEAYSNEDIAEALNIITGTGVIPNAPNEIFSNYVESGVTYGNERLKCSLSGNVVLVGCGAAVIDGSYIIVYEPEKFNISLSGTYYVYLKYNAVGDISVECGNSAPSENCVMLASITDGILADKRKYASSKITNYGTSSLHNLLCETVSYNNAVYTLPDYGFSTIIFIYTGSSKLWDNRAAIYNIETESFQNDCDMLYDTGTSTSHKSVESVSAADNKLSVTFRNMPVENINNTVVYCV